ncbi:hypothetical protein [Burkholderia ambifaria]|uniref:hypothetical protein n=1 Tax=Burkholderia ambifaria TaxID=152480 RepID=UPI00158B046D|nr:hypothetical protein [Burkholderia ambifaria]
MLTSIEWARLSGTVTRDAADQAATIRQRIVAPHTASGAAGTVSDSAKHNA